MEIGNFGIEIIVCPERDIFVCEIFFHSVQWIEMFKESNDTDKLTILFLQHPFSKERKFNLDQAIEVLEIAKAKFLDFMESSRENEENGIGVAHQPLE